MSEERVLRDHRYPCEHKETADLIDGGTGGVKQNYYQGHIVLWEPRMPDGSSWCPGGREVRLDPHKPPKAWTEWAEKGQLEWKFFLAALMEVPDEHGRGVWVTARGDR